MQTSSTSHTEVAVTPARRRAIKIVHVATSDISLRYMLLSQMKHLHSVGYQVTGLSAPGPNLEVVRSEGFPVLTVPFTRRLSPLVDLRALLSMYRLLRRESFDIVHTHTPKASVIGQLAAWLARVPVRLNTVHGFYFHEHTPPRVRRFYVLLERISAYCADRILSQNQEDVETAIRERICGPSKIRHLGNGIDVSQFDPKRVSTKSLQELRREFEISDDSLVVGFVGRLVAEKGLHEFLEAARLVLNVYPKAKFLLVGPTDREKSDALDQDVTEELGIADACLFTGRRDDMPELYSLMDVNVLPSHREGFPRTPMEASLMQTPSVVTDIRGCREAVENGKNGFLTRLRDPQSLADAILLLLGDARMRTEMGKAGRQMALERFDERRVHDIVEKQYAELLQEKLAEASPR